MSNTGLLRGELEALSFGLGGWFRRTPVQRYSFVRGRPWGVILALFGFLLLVETTALHVALAPHARVVAWVLTAMSLYALVWVAGDYHALRLGGLELREDGLVLRFGLRWRAHVPWASVAEVLVSDVRIDRRRERDVLDCRVLRTDVQLVLRAPIVASGPFGLTRPVRKVALAVDRPEAFAAEAREHMQVAAPAPGS
jgi:hypothetical protein